MTDAKGATTNYTYDEQGCVVSQSDADEQLTSYAFTEAGKLVNVTDADGSIQTVTVEGNGFNTSEPDWMGIATTFERNFQNQITKVTGPIHKRYNGTAGVGLGPLLTRTLEPLAMSAASTGPCTPFSGTAFATHL